MGPRLTQNLDFFLISPQKHILWLLNQKNHLNEFYVTVDLEV